MPTKVTPITRETFKPYSKLGKSNSKIQERICELLFRLVQTDDPAKVKRLCQEEIAWLEGEPYAPSSRASYVAAYRKAIAAYFSEHQPPESLLAEKETVKGTVIQHCALNFLFASPADYEYGKQKTKAKTEGQRDNLIGFDAAAAVDATDKALQSDDWRELAVGLIMASQARPSDMLSSGEFKAVSKYRLEFTSRAKKRGAIAKGEIFCLLEAVTFVDAFSRLRRSPEVIKMRSWSLKDIDSGKNATLNRAVERVYGEIMSAPYGEDKLTCKNLRAAGVNVCYWLHGRKNQSLGRFAELQLLHSNPSTAANYEDFYPTDSQGNRLHETGILTDGPLEAKPLSEKRSSLSLDKQLLEMVSDADRWGEGSHADRLERIIAKAEMADRLGAQLARECEKRQRLELELLRLRDAQHKPAPEATSDYQPTGFDWRKVPNEVLKDDLRHDAYKEKLRRSVEAIQEYNAGRELADQYGINTSILRSLAGVSPRLIRPWMDERKAGLESYKEAQGHGYQQNKGKPDPRSIIKWSEAAYGEYEW